MLQSSVLSGPPLAFSFPSAQLSAAGLTNCQIDTLFRDVWENGENWHCLFCGVFSVSLPVAKSGSWMRTGGSVQLVYTVATNRQAYN